MAKKIISTIVMIFIVLLMTCSCGAIGEPEPIKNCGETIQAINLLSKENLVYDINTEIVYLQQGTYGGSQIYTLYLSENGLPCKYIDGQLVEVVR